ncbi:MAG: 1-acyl-sn-glycerol-3-phosphate acyltransferase [Zetaproteobacteria bacterium]|nr:MAG: 1-acyl-sn-glycerol-3-phosphate acyltransferase [Zetaproteobacteria bacterium]
MLILRSALFNLAFFGVTPLFSLALLLVRPWGMGPAWRVARGWSATVLWLARALCGIRLRIEGREHFPDGPCVVVAKHQSALETIAMPLLVPPYVWVLKRILLYIPFFGWALWAIDTIAIDRGTPRQAIKQLLVEGSRRLADGRWVVIFPEGSRSRPGEKLPYRPGGVILAQKARVPLLPLALDSGRCWPKRGFIKRPGLVTFRFLPPIDADTVAAARRDELLAQIEQRIEEECHALLGRNDSGGEPT